MIRMVILGLALVLGGCAYGDEPEAVTTESARDAAPAEASAAYVACTDAAPDAPAADIDAGSGAGDADAAPSVEDAPTFVMMNCKLPTKAEYEAGIGVVCGDN